MNKPRCEWCLGDNLYTEYHDKEWGNPVFDDTLLFEFLILETFQAGLSWITILRKRENFRKAFDDFDYAKIAKYGEQKISYLMEDKGIVRHRLKIQSTIKNSLLFMEIQKEFGSFCNYIWKFSNRKSIVNKYDSLNEIPATTILSDSISKDLKSKGFKFVGSTIIYAYLQAIGVVNDHTKNCFRYNEIINNYK